MKNKTNSEKSEIIATFERVIKMQAEIIKDQQVTVAELRRKQTKTKYDFLQN